MELTLEQLKQQNAAEEAEQQEVATEEVEEVQSVEQEAEVEAVETDGSTETSSEESEEIELWKQDEEQNSSSEESFGNSDMAKLRRKLKAKQDEKDAAHEVELARLRGELEAIKAGNTQSEVAKQAPSKRPTLEQFDYDEDKYQEALESHLLNVIDNRNSQTLTKQQQESEQEKLNADRNKKLDAHYEQVQDLLSNKAITADDYQNSEVIVRRSLERISPGNGDALADGIIAQLASLGEGSAKVIFHLGRNRANRERLVDALVQDNSGLTAMGLLGELKAKLTSAPVKKISSAPEPSAVVSGGESGGNTEAKLKRLYNEAHKSGNAQAAFNAKQEAKKAGINTRNWS